MDNEQKKYKILFEEEAKAMLKNHIQFVANVSKVAAKQLRNTLYNASMSLGTMPARCPLYPTNKAGIICRRLIVAGRYQIIFSVNEEKSTVNIKYFLDSRQNNEI